MARCHGRFALVSGSALLALSFLSATSSRAATHYPPGAICYDCHAVSKSKMVLGTHLLKKSDRTVALGISASSPQAPCLFCHDKNATPSVVDRDRMRGVWDHFGASSASKHPADIRSGFGGNASALDCLDCHAGITVGVDSDGSGNATVHGLDASGDTRLDLYGSLVGTPGDASQVSAATCRNDACHSATGTTTGGYSAPARHGTAQTTIVGGAAPSACTDCHGTHNSYQNTSLVTLRTDGTTSNNPGDPLATRVTPEKCGACHTQDDGPAGGPYAAKGHGQGTISGGSLGCTACHEGSVPHGFSRSAQGTNPLRFKYSENTSVQSAIRREPPYHQAYSVCLTCHSQFTGKLHGGTTAVAGCNDCHEPHGAGVEANVAMIRARIPKVDPAGNPVYGDGSGAAYEVNSYTTFGDAIYKSDGTSLCDNAECHQGRAVNGNALYPLSTLLTGGRHSGGDRPAVDDCADCHSHTDSGGAWGARDSCTTCHGQPPPPADPGYSGLDEATTAHAKHAGSGTGKYGYNCAVCHGQYPAGHRDGTYQSVFFGPLNPGGAYNPGAHTCAGLYCHSDGQTPESTGSAPAWNAGALTCRSCHGGVEGATRIATGSHAAHLAWSGITCLHCHADTVAAVDTDTTTVLPSAGTAAHVNGTKNLKASGTLAGQPVSFSPGAGTCSQISCHGGNGATWGAALSCADCHLRPTAQGGDRDNYAFGDGLVAAAGAEEWAAAGHGRPGASGSYPSGNPAAAFAGPASDPQGCAYCHAPSVGHGLGTNPFRLANKSGTGEDGGWNNACLVCHKTGNAGYDPDGVSGGYAARNATKKVDENHYGSRHAAPALGGTFCWDCHDPHGDAHPYMVHSGDGSAPGRGVTDVSDGVYGVPVSSRPVTGFDVASGGYTSADLANTSNTGLCQTCHAASGGAVSYNRSSFTPLASHNGADATRCTACHRHQKAFGASCVLCHGTDRTFAPSAPKVVDQNDPAGLFGSHLKALRSDGLNRENQGFDWDAQCNKCHTGHSGPVTVPLPPLSWGDPSGRLSGTDMQARLGIGYTRNGGIHLGGTATTGSTEAELCWNCHDAQTPTVSEWGYNTKTTPAGFPVTQFTTASDGTAQTYNFGWLYTSAAYTTKTSDWTAGYWMDQYDPNLKRRVASIHTASFDPAGQSSSVAANVDANGLVNRTNPTLEPKAHIRCSYCHDVHNGNRAQGDVSSGKPFLRGTWVGNPYPPDLPPRARGTHPWMEGPRVVFQNPASQSKGGYFIDKNSGDPTNHVAMDTLGETAGLCALCHGNDVDGMDFYTGSKLWRADTVNGHSNSTLGGTRANARNLFDAGPSGRIVPHGMTAQLELGQSWNEDGSFFWYYGDTGCDCPPAPSGWYPLADRDNWYNPGGIGGAWGTGTMAHKFTCSKCHTPHASGLPALLTTNCIDVKLPNPAGGWGHGLYNESSNCHRKTSASDGWHRLAPAQ